MKRVFAGAALAAALMSGPAFAAQVGDIPHVGDVPGATEPPAVLDPKLSIEIAQAVDNPFRSVNDRPFDVSRRPGPTLNYSGVIWGQKLIELAPLDGYWSMLLYSALGPMGRPYVYSPKLNDANKAFGRAAGGARVVEHPLDDVSVPEHTDVVWSFDNWHEFHNPGVLQADVPIMLHKLYLSLKPGGTLFIIDYAAAPGADLSSTQTLGRIDPAQVIQEVQAAGFKLASTSSILANPNDPHTAPAASLGDKADRMMLKFVKPGQLGDL